MIARRWRVVGLTLGLGLAFSACGGDDDDSTGNEFGNAAGGPMTYAGTTVTNGGSTGTNTGSPGTSGSGGSANGAQGGSMSSGMGFPGGGSGSGFPGGGGSFSMAMCPTTQPEDDSECIGRRLNCTFGAIECRCRRGSWDCGSADEMDGPPEQDGGMR